MALPFPISPDLTTIVHFLLVWLISAFVIWLSVKAFAPGKASFAISAVAAVVGAAIFSFFGRFYGSLYTIIALVLWLFVLKSLFNVGWMRSFLIALGAWILAWIVGWLLGVPVIF